MDGLRVRAGIDGCLTWNYDEGNPRVAALYEQAKAAQWNAGVAVAWNTDVDYGAALPEDSAYAFGAFQGSFLAGYGRPMWDAFRWEFQSWMVSQFLHGEQGALVAAGRLTEVLPHIDAKSFAAIQAVDEARHVEVFSRYLREKVPDGRYPVCPPLASLLRDILGDERWDLVLLGMQIMVEALAMAAFRLANRTFHDPLLRQITHLVARDEARHLSFGIVSLEGAFAQLDAAELAEREDFVLEAAGLMKRRFLLEEVWGRLGVDPAAGRDFALTNTMMVTYRQAVFSRVVAAIARIGLMTPAVYRGLESLDLVDFARRGRFARDNRVITRAS